MKVFISWSGERSKALAVALRDWLPMVLQYIEPWVSDKDIAAGDRWAQSIAGELESSNFGIICITPENLTSEWILFESGALSKSMLDSKVVPLLFGLELSDLSGPLSQFQAQKVELSGITEVVNAINKISEVKAADQTVEKLLPTLWPTLQESLKKIPDKKPTGKHSRPQQEILEELVSGVRGLNARMRDYDPETSQSGRIYRRRKMRFHPRMLDDLAFMSNEVEDPPIILLLLAGQMREDFPWLSELMSESYREIRDGKPDDIEQIFHRLRRTIKHLVHGPMIHEFSGGSKEAMMMAEELPMILDMSLGRMLDRPGPRKLPKQEDTED